MWRKNIFNFIQNPIINLILLILTIFTTTTMGLFEWSYNFFALKGSISNAEIFSSQSLTINEFIRFIFENNFILIEALKYSLALLIFLLAHELGHYLTCRYYGIEATLPYLIPFPAAFGTMGAVIKIKQRIANKKVLFDMAIAGPLAGFIVIVPILYYGLKNSFFISKIPGEAIYFGEPLIWKIIYKTTYGSNLLNLELVAHPVAFASWFGLIATALNLFPMGQLDGGHIIYALFGKKAIVIYKIFFGCLIALCFIWPYWLVWVIIGWFIGLKHPPLIDEDEPLGIGRKILALLAACIFILSFVIIPIKQ